MQTNGACKLRTSLQLGCLVLLTLLLATPCFSASELDATPDPAPGPVIAPLPAGKLPPSPSPVITRKIGIQLRASSLGAGVDLGTRVNDHVNLRVGFDMIGYSGNFSKDGVGYTATISPRTVTSQVDWFPRAGQFRVSAGILHFVGSPVTASFVVPGGMQFDYGNSTYISDPADPMHGSGKLIVRSIAPTLTTGWGNLLRGTHRHFSVPFEIGVAFLGTPSDTLNVQGSVCDVRGRNCDVVPTSSDFQSSMQQEQANINKTLRYVRFFPIVSIGVAYKF